MDSLGNALNRPKIKLFGEFVQKCGPKFTIVVEKLNSNASLASFDWRSDAKMSNRIFGWKVDLTRNNREPNSD